MYKYPKLMIKPGNRYEDEDNHVYAIVPGGMSYSVIGQHSEICEEYINESLPIRFKRWEDAYNNKGIDAVFSSKDNAPNLDPVDVINLLRDLALVGYKLSRLQTEYYKSWYAAAETKARV